MQTVTTGNKRSRALHAAVEVDENRLFSSHTALVVVAVAHVFAI